MKVALLRREVAPFLLIFVLLIAATVVADEVLHRSQLVTVGRYFGILGTVLILLSFLYSLRKRKVIEAGDPRLLLNLHEFLAWLGSLMVLIHAGVHVNALLPWMAVGGMLVNVASGLTGKFLLDRSKRRLTEMREKFQLRGMAKAEVEKALFWDAVTLDVMVKWRAVHFPISLVFAVLASGHILSVCLFWNWK